MEIETVRLDRARDRDAFLGFPTALYRGNSCYVPPLFSERRRFFSPDNPLFAFTEPRYYLLRGKRGRVLGRISAHINRRHNEFTGECTGFFGFFECIPDPAAALALLEAAEADLRGRGMGTIRGPLNFSTHEECGLLAEGFDRPPAVMMPYTPPGYLQFMEVAGYRCVRKLLAFEIKYGDKVFDRLDRLDSRLKKRMGVEIRPIRMDRFETETTALFNLYNRIWSDNWGFVPMTTDQLHFAARELKSVLDPDLILFAEKDGVPVGFVLALPDFHPVLRRMRGRIWPIGWWWLLNRKRLIHRMRILLLGVTVPYRGTGLDSLLCSELTRRYVAKGFSECEASWILDENVAMRRPIERMGGQISKVYHLYEKDLCVSS